MTNEALTAVPLARGLARGTSSLVAVLRSAGAAGKAATTTDALLRAVERGASLQVEVPLNEAGSATRQVTLRGEDAKSFLQGLGCPHCFPAGTWVTTPHGHTAIEKLRVGDLVLAEDPQTGKVAAERVQAVIVRSTSDLMSLDLGDGSSIRVQPDHVFWVDHDPRLKKAGWLAARLLHRGDTLRTVSGRDVAIARLRWHVGRAVVYTLTVAHLHTFFVGSARVLVHNANRINLCDATQYRRVPIIDRKNNIGVAPEDVNGAGVTNSTAYENWARPIQEAYMKSKGYQKIPGGRFHGIDAVWESTAEGEKKYIVTEYKTNKAPYNLTATGRQGSQSWVENDLAKYLAQNSRPDEDAIERAKAITQNGYEVWGIRVWTREGILWVEKIPSAGPYVKG